MATDQKEQTMTTSQTFPAVNIEALPTGLFRLEDPTVIDGPHIIELHPAQVQVLASMVGFDMPDKTRRAIERIHGRVQALSTRAKELAGLLDHALHVQDLDVTPEAQASECIALNLSEVLKDLEDLQAPDLVPIPDAKANPGAQMALPV